MNLFKKELGSGQFGEKPLEHKREGENLESNFNAEAALDKERSVLEKFRGKAKDAAKVMMFISALSFGAGMAGEARAEDSQAAVKVEQVEGQNKEKLEINEKELTNESKWAKDILESAKKELKELKTSEDAELWLISHVNKFIADYIDKFYIAALNGTAKDYTNDDLKYVLKSAQELGEMAQDVRDKFGAKIKNRTKKINMIIKKLKRRTSYAGRKRKEQIDSLLKRFKKF